jgi:sugar phosphate isomerase/epimerase
MLPDSVKLGVVASALSSDPRVAPGLARTAGFQGLQFDARSSALDVAELSGSGRREFRHMLSARNQELVGLRHDVGPEGLAPGADVDRELARLARVMEAATGLGAPLVCVDAGTLPEPQAAPEPPKPKVTPEMAGLILLPGPGDAGQTSLRAARRRAATQPPDPAFVSQVDAALIELGRMADRTSTVIAFRSELSSLAALERALRAADCPWFGVDLDPAAVLADGWDLDETFSRLGPLVRHVRGRDAVGGTGARTKPAAIGRGETDWAHLLSNLNGLDYAGWITVDPVELADRQSAAAQAVRHLRALG